MNTINRISTLSRNELNAVNGLRSETFPVNGGIDNLVYTSSPFESYTEIRVAVRKAIATTISSPMGMDQRVVKAAGVVPNKVEEKVAIQKPVVELTDREKAAIKVEEEKKQEWLNTYVDRLITKQDMIDIALYGTVGESEGFETGGTGGGKVFRIIDGHVVHFEDSEQAYSPLERNVPDAVSEWIKSGVNQWTKEQIEELHKTLRARLTRTEVTMTEVFIENPEDWVNETHREIVLERHDRTSIDSDSDSVINTADPIGYEQSIYNVSGLSQWKNGEFNPKAFHRLTMTGNIRKGLIGLVGVLEPKKLDNLVSRLARKARNTKVVKTRKRSIPLRARDQRNGTVWPPRNRKVDLGSFTEVKAIEPILSISRTTKKFRCVSAINRVKNLKVYGNPESIKSDLGAYKGSPRSKEIFAALTK